MGDIFGDAGDQPDLCRRLHHGAAFAVGAGHAGDARGLSRGAAVAPAARPPSSRVAPSVGSPSPLWGGRIKGGAPRRNARVDIPHPRCHSRGGGNPASSMPHFFRLAHPPSCHPEGRSQGPTLPRAGGGIRVPACAGMTPGGWAVPPNASFATASAYHSATLPTEAGIQRSNPPPAPPP